MASVKPAFGFRFDPKKSFFDTEAVAKRITAAKRQKMRDAGRFVRADAQQSMRRAGKKAFKKFTELMNERRNARRRISGSSLEEQVSLRISAHQEVASQPGRPPRVHSRNRKLSLRDGIQYGYDPASDSVVVGPTLLGNQRSPTVPEVHEFGGQRTVSMRVGRRYRVRFTANYPARPYMGPALAKNESKIAELFKDII